ncbi:hypothetical protein, partial [Rhodococcus sp. Leaf278]|uniref:hypothetical protein n=1 Tax=Rhodococcus sp. Leaf278 TaxID=1736319 RepID=UPI001F2C0A5A
GCLRRVAPAKAYSPDATQTKRYSPDATTQGRAVPLRTAPHGRRWPTYLPLPSQAHRGNPSMGQRTTAAMRRPPQAA